MFVGVFSKLEVSNDSIDFFSELLNVCMEFTIVLLVYLRGCSVTLETISLFLLTTHIFIKGEKCIPQKVSYEF